MSPKMSTIAVWFVLAAAVAGCAVETADEPDEELAGDDDVGLVASALVPAATITGSEGCPAVPTVSVSLSGSRVTFRMQGTNQETSFGAVSGIPDAPYPETAECQLTINLSSETGYQYRVQSLQHRVAYRMPAKGKIRHVSVFKLGSAAEKSKEALVEKGPVNVMTDLTHEGTGEWSACGLKQNLKATARLVTKGPPAGDDPSMVTLLLEPTFFGTLEVQSCELP